jgi:hypothetical protein
LRTFGSCSIIFSIFNIIEFNMFTEFNRTYIESFKRTCSTLIFFIVCWVCAIRTIAIFFEFLTLAEFKKTFCWLRRGITANITNELIISPKVNTDFFITFLNS